MDTEKKKQLEVLIFASPEPLEEKQLLDLFPEFALINIQKLVDAINDEYETSGRPFRIICFLICIMRPLKTSDYY